MQTDDEAVLKLFFTNIKVFVKAVLKTAFYILLFRNIYCIHPKEHFKPHEK